MTVASRTPRRLLASRSLSPTEKPPEDAHRNPGGEGFPSPERIRLEAATKCHGERECANLLAEVPGDRYDQLVSPFTGNATA
jgi:hypothetical protein